MNILCELITFRRFVLFLILFTLTILFVIKFTEFTKTKSSTLVIECHADVPI